MWWSVWDPNGFLMEPWRNCTCESHDLFKSSKGSIQMLLWWTSYQILVL